MGGEGSNQGVDGEIRICNLPEWHFVRGTRAQTLAEQFPWNCDQLALAHNSAPEATRRQPGLPPLPDELSASRHRPDLERRVNRWVAPDVFDRESAWIMRAWVTNLMMLYLGLGDRSNLKPSMLAC